MSHPGGEALTWVELIHHPGAVERWVRFGAHADELILDRRSRFLGFSPGVAFAFVRWAGGDFGTTVSKIAILRAVPRGQPLTTTPGVSPGAEVLLNVSGWSRVRSVLAAIDTVEALGLDAGAAVPDYWRVLHHRVTAGIAARDYSLERHAAWMARKALLS